MDSNANPKVILRAAAPFKDALPMSIRLNMKLMTDGVRLPLMAL
jgi:hypothetical protein